MAYRRIFSVTCVACGLLLAACGSGNGSGGAPDITSDSAPSSADQAPTNKDQAPASSDQAPKSGDAPPSSGAGSGGGAEGACRAFCSAVGGSQGCVGDSQTSKLARAICDAGCTLDAKTVPCESEVVDVISCLKSLNGVCTSDGPSADDADRCENALEAVNNCEDAQMQPVDNPGNGDDCTVAKSCTCGGDVCKICKCTLGENSAACANTCM